MKKHIKNIQIHVAEREMSKHYLKKKKLKIKIPIEYCNLVIKNKSQKHYKSFKISYIKLPDFKSKDS